MKKFLIFYFIVLFVITITILNKDNKELIFKIGDSLSLSKNSFNSRSYDNYFKDYLKNKFEDYIVYGYSNYRIGELKRDISDNIIINNRPIQNILIKSDLVIIEIGIDELMYALNVLEKYEYLDGMINSMEELIKLIKKYCKEKILLVGYYNPSNEDDKYIEYINNKYFELSKKYNIYYLDITELNKKMYFSSNNHYLNDKGYNWLNTQIIKTIY
jgi:lysophospholipase L1-like esterase